MSPSTCPFCGRERPQLAVIGNDRAQIVVVTCLECGSIRPRSTGDNPPSGNGASPGVSTTSASVVGMRAFADEFFSYLDTAHAGIAGASGRVVGEHFADHLHAWLRVLYAVIRATTPLLVFSLQCLERRPKDAFTSDLRSYFSSRIEEEAGHDDMLLEDLRKLGIQPASLVNDLPPSAIVAMVGSQYYLIEHLHPAVHLGYVGLVEGYPPNLDDVAALVAMSGTAPEAWSTYRLHAALDPEHRRELVNVLNAVPEEPWLRRAIIANGIRSAEHYCQCLETIAGGRGA